MGVACGRVRSTEVYSAQELIDYHNSMFLWIDVSPLPDTYDLVMGKALAKGVLAIPGFAFMPNGGKTSFVRASFSIVDMQDAEQGFKALGEAIREMRGELSL
jgi:tryptophan aminotransferase